MSPYRAVIFDMDGVLVDSEPAYFEAVNEVLQPTGKQIDWEQYQQLLGTSITTTWQSVVKMLGIEADLEAFKEQYNDVILKVLARPRPLLPSVKALIAELRQRGASIGLATSSRQAWVEAVLSAVELPLDTFDAVVWRQMAERSKPAPDLYLKAAELVGVSPESCVAIEDTPSGIAAAKAAGMYAVQVRAASTAFPPIEQADLVLDSLEDFPLTLVAAE